MKKIPDPVKSLSACAALALVTIAAQTSPVRAASPPAPAVRYAAPVPAGAEDCSTPANACDLRTAATAASVADGDEIVLAPGDYALVTELRLTAAIDMHGEAAPASTRIASTGIFGITVANPDARLHDLEITVDGVGAALGAFSGTVERVVAVNAGGTACSIGEPTIVDSICVSGGPGVAGVSLAWSGGVHRATLRNVTAIGSGLGSYGIYVDAGLGTVAEIDAENVIARGVAYDVRASAETGSTATVTLNHSNYESTQVLWLGGMAAVADAGSNQTAAPAFVDAAGGDFHQASGSPTVDAGVAGPLSGPFDVDGEARSQGAAIDIGADEATVAPPSVPSPPPSSGEAPAARAGGPPETLITAAPRRRVTTTRRRTAARFAFVSDAAGASFECRLDRAAFAPCTSPLRLRVGSGRHSFQVRAVDGAGGKVDASPVVRVWKVARRPANPS